jgi:hypothetical protein
MDELGLDSEDVAAWFADSQLTPFRIAKLRDTVAPLLPSFLFDAVRRAYIADSVVADSAAKHGLPHSHVIASKLPDPGSVMAGDFGEILVYIYHAAAAHPNQKLIGPKKWRLKQDRKKPAPHSDVVHFFLPEWPNASTKDAVVCSEVKTKSTDSKSDPIATAIAGSVKDRTSRLSKTLVWLRERALTEELGAISIDQLNRFINATAFPGATWRYLAVAVICSTLVEAELAALSAVCPPDVSLIVLVVPNLKDTYTAVFDAVHSQPMSVSV